MPNPWLGRKDERFFMFKFWKLSASVVTLALCLMLVPCIREVRNLRINSIWCLILFAPAIFAWLWAQVRIRQTIRFMIAVLAISSIPFTWGMGRPVIVMISVALLCVVMFTEEDSSIHPSATRE